MKRGKVGQNVVRPMFPRLNVNDTEKGGPRAPPRNKMALYEQLSIPSQRFNQGRLSVRVDSDNSVHPPSSSQMSGSDRKIFFPLHFPLSNPTFLPEKLSGLESDRSNMNTSVARLGRQNKSGDEDDFTVPVFTCSQEGREKNQKIKHNKNFTPSNSDHFCHHSVRTQTQNSRPEKNLAETETYDRELEEDDKCSGESENNESMKKIEVANASEPKRDSPSGTTVGGNDVSEASILDSISAMDISPDDTVGIIGQKHFWTARRAIVNQQRVFAGQVFELHRLIKVQKLIAASPHFLLENISTTPSKPSSKGSPATKLLVENHNKSLSPAMRCSGEPQKPTHPVEFSVENAIGQTPVFTNTSASPFGPPAVSSLGKWCPTQHHAPGQQQLLIPVMSPTEGLVYKPYPRPVFGSTGLSGPSCSSPITMSNFGNPAHGVPAIQGMGFIPGIPHAGHSYFPTYGMPIMSLGDSSQGSGFISAIEQVNGPTDPAPGIQTGQVLRQELKNLQHQSTSINNNVPVPKTAPTVARPRALKVSNLQGSTGSSPENDKAEPTQTVSSHRPCPPNELGGTELGSFSKSAKDPGNVRIIDGKDELPLFPMAPAAADADRSARVIRAVPHNARSASASAAQIFRSIQEERKQYDSA